MALIERKMMNFFDIVTFITIVWAVVSGWRSGFVSQLFSLAGVVAGAILSVKYGAAVGSMLGIDERFATVAGFLITFVGILIVATIVSKLLAKVISFIGLGWINTVLGIMLSVLKGLLILSLAFASIEAMNRELHFVESEYFDKAHTFHLVRNASEPIFKYLVEAKDSVMNSI